jgi:hypothetical protein
MTKQLNDHGLPSICWGGGNEKFSFATTHGRSERDFNNYFDLAERAYLAVLEHTYRSYGVRQSSHGDLSVGGMHISRGRGNSYFVMAEGLELDLELNEFPFCELAVAA